MTANILDALNAAVARTRDPRYGREGLNIILETNPVVEREAMRVTDRFGKGDTMPLAGVAVVSKPNIATTTMTTSCGSRILRGYISPYEATAVTRLRDRGAVVVANANMDEFAMGSSTEHSAFGPTRNPIDPDRAPGGSSGGSAAAVAAGIVRIALGSETGGSVRQPAAFCGVIGVKPTYGRVSRYGLVAFGSSLDQIGVCASNVHDAALATYAISGRDAMDSTSADVAVPDSPPEAQHERGNSLHGVVIGVPKEYFPDTLSSALRARADAAIERMRAMGATIRDVSLPHTSYAVPVYYIIAPAEASSNLARFDGVRYGPRWNERGDLRDLYDSTRTHGFGTEVKRRILIGTYVLSHGYYDAYYRKAQAVRALIANDFSSVFSDGVHALFTPTTPSPAFRIGEVTDPYSMYLSDIFTAPANLAGVPAISIPIGDVEGLPVGGQIIAPHFGEPTMFRVAAALEAAQNAWSAR